MVVDTVKLSMGSLSEVKVNNFDKLVNDATVALDNYRLSGSKRISIADTLNRIKNTPDYTVTPELVNEVDDVINEASVYVVSDDGDVKPIMMTGAEQFSYTLTPSQWKATRIAGCESLLKDLAKKMLKWAKQIKEKTQEIWLNFNYNIEGLSESINVIDGQIAKLTPSNNKNLTVTVPKKIAQMLSGARNEQVGDSKSDERIRNDILYLLTVIKVWQSESVDYKNKFIRYFGNNGKYDYTFLYRKHPSFFSSKISQDEKVNELYYWGPTSRFIGNGGIFFSELTIPLTSLDDVRKHVSESRYVITSPIMDSSFKDVTMPVYNLKQLDNLYQVLVKITSILEMLNGKENIFTLAEREVRDIITSLSEDSSDDSLALIENLSDIAGFYQENTFSTQIGFFKYLFNLSAILIDFISLHIKAHDEQS